MGYSFLTFLFNSEIFHIISHSSPVWISRMARNSGLAVLSFIDECITCITALPETEPRSRYCSLSSYLSVVKGSLLLFFGISILIPVAYARGGDKTKKEVLLALKRIQKLTTQVEGKSFCCKDNSFLIFEV